MAKTAASTPDALAPTMATRTAATAAYGGRKKKEVPPPKPIPLQVRWPREDVKAVKVAAAQAEQTISAFLLTCFHAYVERKK